MYPNMTVSARIIDNRFHHLCVSFEQVFFLECVKVRIHLVCLDGVLHLLYLPDGRNDVFAVDDVAHSIRMITYATKPREVQERIKREQRTHLGEDLMD